MELLILSILLSLVVQSGLNWTLVFFQRNHISKSFLGVFSVSLAVVDTTLTLCVSALYFADGSLTLLGLKLTRFHVCFLVQVLGQVYSSLQGPVLCLAALDHFSTVGQSGHRTAARPRWFSHLVLTVVAWYAAFLYVFLLSDFVPVLEDVPHSQIHQCWVFHTSQMLQVAMFVLAVGCTMVHVGYNVGLLRDPPSKERIGAETGPHRERSIIRQTTEILLRTWTPFLLLLAVVLLFPMVIPAHHGLNGAWICFLNSLLIAVALCVVQPVAQLAHNLDTVPPDSFCEWRFKFSLATEDTT